MYKTGSNDLRFVDYQGANWGDRLTLQAVTGHVGIGDQNPQAFLSVAGGSYNSTAIFTSASTAGTGLVLQNTSTGGHKFDLISTGAEDGPGAGALGVFDETAAAYRLTVLPDGRVGIGVTIPTATLDVNGNINVSGNINAKYQDVAEWVPTTAALEPGTVVVLDRHVSNHVTESRVAYDTSVAGVVSAQPGITLGDAAAGETKVATLGRVRVKADGTAPISIGDLLVTSNIPGVAMKSEPLNVSGRSFHQPGTIIGKALESLACGRGQILVLLTLQ